MYTTGDILLKIPGISRGILYNWVSHGYLSPDHAPIGDKGYRRKEFSEADFLKIRLMWKFYQEQGLPPRVASFKAAEVLDQPFALRLSVDKTFQQGAFSFDVLRFSVMEEFEVIATLEAYQVESCDVSVLFDPRYLSLETGALNRRLQLDVYDEVDVCWGFCTTQMTREGPIYISIDTRSDEATRVVSIPVEIR